MHVTNFLLIAALIFVQYQSSEKITWLFEQDTDKNLQIAALEQQVERLQLTSGRTIDSLYAIRMDLEENKMQDIERANPDVDFREALK